MSNHRNYRRDEHARTEHGPAWESHNPGKGCNSTHVARGRKKWKTRIRRAIRRQLDKFDDWWDEIYEETHQD